MARSATPADTFARRLRDSRRRERELQAQIAVLEAQLRQASPVEPWDEAIGRYLERHRPKAGPERYLTRHILQDALGIAVEDQDRDAYLRLAKLMSRRGYTPGMIESDEGRGRGWRRPAYA